MVLNEKEAAQAFKAFDEAKYYKVAEVKSTKLKKAYKNTNNINLPWPENPNVKTFGGVRQRSTSAGNIMEKDGKLYIVGSIGLYERNKNGHIYRSHAW